MAETKEQRLRKVHDRAMERFDRCYSSQMEIRLRCVQDRRFAFVEGAQFEGDLGEQFENRPRFEINKLQQSIIRLISEYRNNRVSVDFRPADLDTSDETAEFLDGLYRGDEQDSAAQEAYDTAFEEGVTGGMGAWRLVNQYENDDADDEGAEDDDRRRICIEPIPDADNSVFFDIDAKRYDKRDATFAFVVSGMQAPAWEDLSGEVASVVVSEWQKRRKAAGSITSFDKVTRMTAYDWYTPDVIYVSEYFELEEIPEVVNFYENPLSGETQKLKPKRMEKDDFEQAEADLLAQGFRLVRTKKLKRRVVHKYLIDGNKVLEDCGVIAGKYIPIVPFYAKRQFVDNIERIQGHIRLGTDLQRLYNMVLSMLGELTTYSWVEKPVLTPGQIAGHEETWALDPVKRFPYLVVNPTIAPDGSDLGVPALQYTKAPNIPPALAALLQLIGVDLKEILNTGSDQQQVVSNISAKAVELIQNRLDMQTFIYMDNFKKSMKRSGEIWLSMAQDLYDEEERPMRIVNEDGTDDIVKLREKSLDKKGAVVMANDPGSGNFKVIADVGPSYTTRRDGTVRAVTGMLQFVQDPADQAVLTSVAVKNMEGEGLEPVKKYFRGKLLALGLEKPTDQEQEEMAASQQAQPPDAQQVFLLAEAQKSAALAEKAQADAQKALAEADKTRAEMAEIAAKLNTVDIDQLLKVLEAARGQEVATTS